MRVGREHGEGSTNTEVQHTHPQHESPLAVFGREGKRRQEGGENSKHQTHRLLVSQLIVLRFSLHRSSYHPAPERTANAVADGRDGSDQCEEEIIVNNHLTEKLSIMFILQEYLEEGRNEDVRNGHEHDGEPELPESALLDSILRAHAILFRFTYLSEASNCFTGIEECFRLFSHLLHIFFRGL